MNNNKLSLMYSIEIPIISTLENWRFKYITTFLQKEICKALFEETNYTLFNDIINNVIKECAHPQHNIELLTILDKLIILLRLRSISIGNVLNFSIEKNNKKYNVEYNFNKILIDVYNIYKEIPVFSCQKNNLEIKCGVPYIKWESSLIEDNSIVYFIKSLKIFNTDTNFSNLNREDQTTLLSKLPASIILEINNYIININNSLAKVNIYDVIDSTLPLTLFGDTIFEYIKFLFRENLHNIYYDIYALNTHLNFNAAYIETLSPIEREMFINMYKKENQKNNISPSPQSSEQFQQQNTNINTSLDNLIEDLDVYKSAKGG